MLDRCVVYTAAMSEGWIAEAVVDFLRSPTWTKPIQEFLAANSDLFSGCETEEFSHDQFDAHRRFQALIDGLLSGFLDELGVPYDTFIALAKERTTEVANLVLQYIVALDDLTCFRRLMQKNNHELELQMLYENARIVSCAEAALGEDDIDDEEMFLLELAMKASLGVCEETLASLMGTLEQKLELLREAEALQQLAVEIALEHERLVAAGATAEEAARATASSEALLRQQKDLPPIGMKPRAGFATGAPLPPISSATAVAPSVHPIAMKSVKPEVAPAAVAIHAAESDESIVQARAEYLRALRDRVKAKQATQDSAPSPPVATGVAPMQPSKVENKVASPKNDGRLEIMQRFRADLLAESAKPL